VSDDVVIITPELPGAGGVGDYTQHLIETWSVPENVRLVVPREGAIEFAIPERKILVQYSAYGFDRLGYPRKLIRRLIDWKIQTRGCLVVVFHEIWSFWPLLNKNAVVQFFHRRSIGQLIDVADVVFTTTSAQAAHLKKLSPGKSISVLPVGSNIRRDVALPREPGLAVLFASEPGRVSALKAMQKGLRPLAQTGLVGKIITVGKGDGGFLTEESDLLAHLQLKDGFEQRGRRSETEVSRLLFSASFGISGQSSLSLEKSSAFMAYAAHGLNVLSEFADPTKDEPLCALVSPDELLRGISQPELRARAARLQAWQECVSSWDVIATRLAEALQSAG
jgi:hypothetical protein